MRWLAIGLSIAFAEPVVAAPLTLSEVLKSSARAQPQIIAALAQVRQARGRALSAEGAFDTVFDVDSRSRAAGFYDGTVVSARATRPLTDNGGYLYGGYRISRGDFPIYEDEAFTNRLGELKVGGLYALLRDRLVDERRTRSNLAAADIEIARFEAQAVTIGVQRRAIDAYQLWVAAGLRLRAFRALLGLAEDRRTGIARTVELGARPNILLIEAEQNLVRRQALVLRAEQDLAAAANNLSLYLRTDDGRPLLVSADRLPTDVDALAALSPAAAPGLVNRPDLAVLLKRIDQSVARLALAENDLRPRLDLRGEAGKDLGDEGLGGRSRTPFEIVVGVRFSMPLQNRAAKGRVAETRAEIDLLEARSRYLQEQVAVEVDGVVIALTAADRLAAVAAEEQVLADRLAAAERRRFALGVGDFFLVNQREEAATDAAVRLIDARARSAAASAELAAATGDLATLQIDVAP